MIINTKGKYGHDCRAFVLSTGRHLLFDGPFPGYNAIQIHEISSPSITPQEMVELADHLKALAAQMAHPNGVVTEPMLHLSPVTR